MKASTVAALASVVIGVQAQGQTSVISPSAPAPTGCSTTGKGQYEVQVVLPAGTKAKRQSNQFHPDGPLIFSITNGIATDKYGRIGAIVSNHQFQFDGPPAQAGSIYTAGWSVCQNNSLAIGGTTRFFQCRSGPYYNLYDEAIPGADGCQEVRLNLLPYNAGTTGAVTQQPDGQPTAPAAVSQQPDGQPTAPAAVPVVSQYSDGQPQVPTGVVSQIGDGQPQNPTGVVSQIGDGQPQATAVVSQIGDGQPQAGNGTVSSPTPSTSPIATGAASSLFASGALAVAGAVAVLFL